MFFQKDYNAPPEEESPPAGGGVPARRRGPSVLLAPGRGGPPGC